MQDMYNMEYSRDGMAAIHVAAAQNLPPRVQRLVQISHTLLEARTFNKVSMTPLMVAAAHGASETFHTLMGLGANLLAQSRTGMNAMSYAATRGHTAIVLSLLGNREIDVMQELLQQLQQPLSYIEKMNCLRVLVGVTQAIVDEPTDRFSHGRSKADHLRELGVVAAIDNLLKKVTSEESGWESPAQQLMQVVVHLTSAGTQVNSDIVTNSSILQTLVGIMQNCDEPSTCIAVIHALKAVIKRDSSACFLIVSMNTPHIMMEAMSKHRSESFLEAATGCLEISTSRPEVARAFLESGVLPGLSRMVGSPLLPPGVSSSLLNTIDNIAMCSEEARKEVVSLGVVQALLGMLRTERINHVGRILRLLHTLCLGKRDGADIMRKSPQDISRLVSLVRLTTSPLPVQQASFDLLWCMTRGEEGERRALAGLVGARCLSSMLDRGAEGLQGKVLNALLLIAPPVHGVQEEIVDTGCVHSLVRIIDQAGCKPSSNVTCALRILETLSCTMAMKPNRKFQQLAEKLGGWRCLLKLYSVTTDKETQAQIMCSLAALTVGNPVLKQLLLQDPHFDPSQVASSMVAMEINQVSTVFRGLCYLLYNSRDLQGWLVERGGLPYVVFKTHQRSQDKSERAWASFEAVVMAKLFTDQDGTSIMVEGIKTLSSLLGEVVEEGIRDLQVLVGSLVCALVRTGDGLGSAFLSLGVARPLVAMLLGLHEGGLKTSALALCLLSHLPQGARVVMKYGRRAPYLVPLIQRYSPVHPLSQGFYEDWMQYCKDHPEAAAKQLSRLTKNTVTPSLYSAAQVFANVKVEESPALTDPGEVQEEKEEGPMVSCGVSLHRSRDTAVSKSRMSVVNFKLPLIMHPNV